MQEIQADLRGSLRACAVLVRLIYQPLVRSFMSRVVGDDLQVLRVSGGLFAEEFGMSRRSFDMATTINSVFTTSSNLI